MTYKKNIFILTIATVIFSGCMGIKPGATNSVLKLYETFFVGSEGTQYFIKPLSFAGNNNDELLIDFTFRYKNQVKDSVICNFSIISAEKLKEVDEVLLATEDISVKCENITLLFNDKKGDLFLSRFSGRLLFADFNKLFNAGNFTVEADHAVYTLSAKTQKPVEELRKKLFVLFD